MWTRRLCRHANASSHGSGRGSGGWKARTAHRQFLHEWLVPTRVDGAALVVCRFRRRRACASSASPAASSTTVFSDGSRACASGVLVVDLASPVQVPRLPPLPAGTQIPNSPAVLRRVRHELRRVHTGGWLRAHVSVITPADQKKVCRCCPVNSSVSQFLVYRYDRDGTGQRKKALGCWV
jgi:hypothetical protein